MNKLYNRIIIRIAERHITSAYDEGYNLGRARGANRSRSDIVSKLESLDIDKFNNTALSLGFNTALQLAKES